MLLLHLVWTKKSKSNLLCHLKRRKEKEKEENRKWKLRVKEKNCLMVWIKYSSPADFTVLYIFSRVLTRKRRQGKVFKASKDIFEHVSLIVSCVVSKKVLSKTEISSKFSFEIIRRRSKWFKFAKARGWKTFFCWHDKKSRLTKNSMECLKRICDLQSLMCAFWGSKFPTYYENERRNFSSFSVIKSN